MNRVSNLAGAAHAPDWFETHAELLAFARVLVASFDWSAADLLAYLEKPWKWSPEHAIWCELGQPDCIPEEAVS